MIDLPQKCEPRADRRWNSNAASLLSVLRLIQHQPHGSILLGITAAGLLAFGIYGVAEAAFGRFATPSPHHARLAS